jgi:hypothetical protein
LQATGAHTPPPRLAGRWMRMAQIPDYVLRVELSIYVGDKLGHLNLVCHAGNADAARWIAWSIAKAHSVPNRYFNTPEGVVKDLGVPA